MMFPNLLVALVALSLATVPVDASMMRDEEVPSSSSRGISFKLGAPGEEWSGPNHFLREIGADMRLKSPFQRQPTATQLFPIGVQGSVPTKDDKERKLFFEGLEGEFMEEPAPAPKQCPGNFRCGPCREVSVYGYGTDTFKTAQGADVKFCGFSTTCGTRINTGSCADATRNCFNNFCAQNQFPDSNSNNFPYCYAQIPKSEIDGDCPEKAISDLNNYRDVRRLGKKKDSIKVFSDRQDDLDGTNRRSLSIPPLQKRLTLMGFVRIPKTGSTTLVSFMDHAENMHSWDAYLPSTTTTSDDSGDRQTFATFGDKNAELTMTTTSKKKRRRRKSAKGNFGYAGCVYGYASSKAHLGSPSKDGLFYNRCPHIPYGKLVEQWAKSLPLWSPPEFATDHNQEDTVPAIIVNKDSEPYVMSFEGFTIVRHPFDRLVSYFYYLRKFTDSNEFLKHTNSVAQYERVRENDLGGWLELLHTEDGGCGLELPYQYKYLHEDVDMAIGLIRNNASPQVYTLVTECYEASLYLLTENFEGFEDGLVEAFVESEDFNSNNNKASYSERPDKETLAELRAKTEVWFADDYKFYDVAVEEFIKKLEGSNLSKSVLESCKYWNKGSKKIGDTAAME